MHISKDKLIKEAENVLLVALGTWLLCFLFLLSSCSPKVIYQKETVIEYRDRVVHDTTTFEIEKEVEKIVTRDTVSHLENKYAKSDATVSEGFLHHSLESIPQIITVPVEVHVRDTVTVEKEAQIIEKEVKVEVPLPWWKQFFIKAFPWVLLGLILSLVWIFRKWIFKI